MSDEQKKNLALDALQKIKDAEDEARKIIQDAHEKTSVKIIQDAQKDADEVKERMLAEARDKARERKKSIIQGAKLEVKKIAAEAQTEIERLRNLPTDSRSRAIEKVAENIRSAVRGGHL